MKKNYHLSKKKCRHWSNRFFFRNSGTGHFVDEIHFDANQILFEILTFFLSLSHSETSRLYVFFTDSVHCLIFNLLQWQWVLELSKQIGVTRIFAPCTDRSHLVKKNEIPTRKSFCYRSPMATRQSKVKIFRRMKEARWFESIQIFWTGLVSMSVYCEVSSSDYHLHTRQTDIINEQKVYTEFHIDENNYEI